MTWRLSYLDADWVAAIYLWGDAAGRFGGAVDWLVRVRADERAHDDGARVRAGSLDEALEQAIDALRAAGVKSGPARLFLEPRRRHYVTIEIRATACQQRAARRRRAKLALVR